MIPLSLLKLYRIDGGGQLIHIVWHPVGSVPRICNLETLLDLSFDLPKVLIAYGNLYNTISTKGTQLLN